MHRKILGVKTLVDRGGRGFGVRSCGINQRSFEYGVNS